MRSTILVAACLLTLPAFGQVPHFRFTGDEFADHFGSACSGAGDVDGDGVGDLIVAAVGATGPLGESMGMVRVFSGRTGEVLHEFRGPQEPSGFGFAVDGAGDVNGDGHADLIVGAHFGSSGPIPGGNVYVYSGRDGSLLHRLDASQRYMQFGRAVAGVGDLDQDGFPDLVVGAPGAGELLAPAGRALAYSGKTGKLLWVVDGSILNGGLGEDVSSAGDVDGDGVDDVIVGARGRIHQSVNTGVAMVLSGTTGARIYSFRSLADDDHFAHSVASLGDVNGDGFADVAVGAYFAQGSQGEVTVFSGLDGSILYSFTDPDVTALGFSLDRAGDIDGDGIDDLVVGSHIGGTNSAGVVQARSGVDGSLLYSFRGWQVGGESRMGFAVGGVGDLDGDGLADVIAGAPWSDPNGWRSGAARVILSSVHLGTPYCTPPQPNSTTQVARLYAVGSRVVSNNAFELIATQLPQNQAAIFLVSDTESFVPGAGGGAGNLCLGGAIGRFSQVLNSGTASVVSITVDLTQLPTQPPHTVFAGETWRFQCWYRDFSTSNFTQGLRVKFK